MDDPVPQERPAFIFPHSDHGDPECCGLLMPVARGDQAHITCNECGALVSIVPLSHADAALAEMVSSEFCTARCPHCDVNMFPGFSAIEAFICKECGNGVSIERPVQ